MADETLDVEYGEMMQRIAGGTAHYDDRWTSWFGESTDGNFEDKIRDTFERTGHLPSAPQYEAAVAEGKRVEEAVAVDEGGEPEAEPQARATKKKS